MFSTGYADVKVSLIDINDNDPLFPAVKINRTNTVSLLHRIILVLVLHEGWLASCYLLYITFSFFQRYKEDILLLKMNVIFDYKTESS